VIPLFFVHNGTCKIPALTALFPLRTSTRTGAWTNSTGNPGIVIAAV